MSAVGANDANIVYSPLTWEVTATRAKSINAGAYFRAAFDGAPSGLVMNFDVTGSIAPTPVIAVRVNGAVWERKKVAASVAVAIPTDRVWPVTTVEMMLSAAGGGPDRWNTQSSGIQFTGFTSTGELHTRTSAALPKRVLCLGDSLAQGILTLGAASGVLSNNAAELGWAHLLSSALGAEVGVRGFGGVGLTVVGDGAVPVFGSIWDKLWQGKNADFANEAPDLVVLMVGTNDSAGTDQAVTAAMKSLLDAITAKVACPVLVVENLKKVKTSAIRAGITGSARPARVTWMPAPAWSTTDSSDGWHPYGYSNTIDVVPAIAAAVNAMTPNAGGGAFVFDGTNWVPLL